MVRDQGHLIEHVPTTFPITIIYIIWRVSNNETNWTNCPLIGKRLVGAFILNNPNRRHPVVKNISIP
jgi:hypothetical protein